MSFLIRTPILGSMTGEHLHCTECGETVTIPYKAVVVSHDCAGSPMVKPQPPPFDECGQPFPCAHRGHDPFCNHPVATGLEDVR